MSRVTEWITPRRRRGVEWLDDPDFDASVRARSLADVVRSNSLFGGMRSALRAISAQLRALGGSRVTLLDVGTGLADIPAAAALRARRFGVELVTIGIDFTPDPLAVARTRVTHVACGSAFSLPIATGSVDLVTASQVLHHFDDAGVVAVIRELDRVAARGVVVCDLRRSWIAAGAFWLASWPLRFHPVTRHDGTTSVLRGFTAAELTDLVRRATGRHATVERHAGCRLSATWSVTQRGDRAQ